MKKKLTFHQNSLNNNEKTSPIDEPVVLGKIGACYGVFGWLKVFSSTEEAAGIFSYQPWFVQRMNRWQKLSLENWKYHNQNMLIKLKGVDDRNAAHLLINCEIIIDSSQLPVLEEDFYYWKDLVGCQVLTVEGHSLGIVFSMMKTGSNDVLIVKMTREDNSFVKERLIPFLNNRVIKQVDLVNRTIEVDWSFDC